MVVFLTCHPLLAKVKINEGITHWSVLADFDQKKKKPGKKLEAIIDKEISLVGFMMPLDNNATKSIKEFLLVPYFPSCIHVPPPPSNQIVLVSYKGKKDLPLHYGLITVKGVFKMASAKKKVKKNRMLTMMPDASYSMSSQSVVKFRRK